MPDPFVVVSAWQCPFHINGLVELSDLMLKG
jgi:hypothetical protein